MADSKLLEKWVGDALNIANVIKKYPESCLPTKFKTPTGKVKKCAFESIAPNIFEKTAKIDAFRIVREDVYYWIKAL